MPLTDEDLNKIQAMLVGLATKDDLCIMKDEIMEELSKKADKGDVDRMESRLITAMGLVERDHDMRLTDLETRVKRLERVPAQ